jgi:hypothetical protein
MDEKQDSPNGPEPVVAAPVVADVAPPVRPPTEGTPASPGKRQRRPRGRWGVGILGLVAGLVGVAGLAASGWVYTELRSENLRLATQIAQLKLSLDLYAQRQTAVAPPATADNEPADEALTDLSNRLAILEQNWRDAAPTAATNGPALLPPIEGASSGQAANPDDCLPTGTRFMVAAGDSWPICGTGAVVDVGAVDDGFITLADGTVIAQGGNIRLPGSQCMIGLVPSDGGSVSGFAEIRVSC